PVKEDKESIISQLHDLLKQVSELSEQEVITIFENKFKDLSQSWGNIQQLPKDIEEELLAQYNDVSQSIKNTIKNHIKTQELNNSFEKLNKDLKKLIDQPKRLSEKTLANMEQQIRQAFSLANTDNAGKLKSELYALLQKAETELNSKEEKISADFKKLKTELTSVEAKLSDGLLNEALNARKNVTHLLDNLEKLGHRGLEEYKRQANTISNRINELSGWRSWANTPVKEELCEKVEALIDSDEDPKNIAFIIKQAREEWKKFGPAEREASQELWERFNTACEKAYEPCKAYFEEESQQRQANYEKRLAFVEDLEKFVETADWENVDWKKVESLFRHSRNEWKDLGPTNEKQRKTLNKRFYAAFETIKAELVKEWDKNREAKDAIVAKAKELVNEEDLDSAINSVKALQADWKKAGRIPQKQERELWAEFRKSCDAIFQRRDALKEQAKEELQVKAQQKAALCDALDQIVKLDPIEFQAQQSTFEKTLREFKEFGTTLKKEDEKLNKKLEEILDIYERKLESSDRINDVRKLQDLQKVTTSLEALEELIETNQSAVHINEAVESIRNTLDDIKLPEEWLQKLESRLDSAIKIASSQNFSEALSSSFSEAAEEKKFNTILLEILANVETPAEFADDRMQVQTQRLSDKLQNQEEENHWQRFISAESSWWLCGPSPKSTLASYKQRHDKAIEQLHNDYMEELKDYS
ncbi:MAG: DUF349 domain-containing protein, partial [Gammaproteobacteria bacterium]|nr:DUF349 domain-containing protein [Gammaproteobacteria bacterium]